MLVYKYREYSKPIDRINLENRPLTKDIKIVIIYVQQKIIFASVLKNIKKDLDRIKNKCYNISIEKQKKILQNLEKWIDKIKLICYTILKGNDTAHKNKKGY